MTRQEAIERIKKATKFDVVDVYIIDVLEALGLLKFEEEKKELPASSVIAEYLFKVGVLRANDTASACMNELYNAGYRVVRK